MLSVVPGVPGCQAVLQRRRLPTIEGHKLGWLQPSAPIGP
jgi:hypothetical protein